MALTREEERYYEETLATMKSPGWKMLVEDWKAQRESFANIASITTTEQLWFQKGRIDQLDYLLKLVETFEKAYDEMSVR